MPAVQVGFNKLAYLVEPELLPEPVVPELPEPVAPELPEPMLPPEVLPAPVELPEPVVEPLVPPAEEPEEPKCASHSERDTCPSLSLSTVENSGAEDDAPLAALPPEVDGVDEVAPLEPLAPEPAVPELELDGLEEVAPLELLSLAPVLPAPALSPAAKAAFERAKRAAAVAAARSFSCMCMLL